MSLKVWIGDSYDRRHEQEQIRDFLGLMHAEFDSQPGQVHLLCNFICGGCQVDAAILKKDAFVPIEFKTAPGPVSGAENGKWRFEDPKSGRQVTMGGGSHAANPFCQIGNARTAIANKLEAEERLFLRPHEEERVADWRHFVHGLVVLAPDLDEGDEIGVDFYAKPWFECCRMNKAAERLFRTTTRDGELSGKNLLNIIKKVLKLEEAEIRDGVPMLITEEGFEEEYEVSTATVDEEAVESDSGEEVPKVGDGSSVETLASLFDAALQPQSPPSDVLAEEEIAEPVREEKKRISATDYSKIQETLETLNEFVCEDLPQFVSGSAGGYSYDQKDRLPVKVEGEWDFVIVLKTKGVPEQAFKEIRDYWKCNYTKPYLADGHVVWRFPEYIPPAKPVRPVFHTVGFFPPSFTAAIQALPHTQYSPNALEVAQNLKSSEDQVLWYLGNYFPRSFCETFCAFDYLIGCLGDKFKVGDEVRILDLGIGSGGSTYGLVWALRKWFYKSLKRIFIVGVDGNEHALGLCGELTSVAGGGWGCEIKLTTRLSPLAANADDLSDLLGPFDFVLASKTLQETKGEFSYTDFLALAKSRLSPQGFAFLLDIANEERRKKMKNLEGHRDTGMACVLSSLEQEELSFHVLSSLTDQSMVENVLFSIWSRSSLGASIEGTVDFRTVLPQRHVVHKKGKINEADLRSRRPVGSQPASRL